MNQRDRLYIQRELIAYFQWLREGCTFSGNALGFRPATIEYELMHGAPGGGSGGKSKVQTHFHGDKNVEVLHREMSRIQEPVRVALTGVYGYRWSEQRTADVIGTTRHQIRNRLSTGYIELFEAISTTEKHR